MKFYVAHSDAASPIRQSESKSESDASSASSFHPGEVPAARNLGGGPARRCEAAAGGPPPARPARPMAAAASALGRALARGGGHGPRSAAARGGGRGRGRGVYSEAGQREGPSLGFYDTAVEEYAQMPTQEASLQAMFEQGTRAHGDPEVVMQSAKCVRARPAPGAGRGRGLTGSQNANPKATSCGSSPSASPAGSSTCSSSRTSSSSTR